MSTARRSKNSFGNSKAVVQETPVKRSADSQQDSRTELGRRLREIRRQIEVSGEPLLNLNELKRELVDRRGES